MLDFEEWPIDRVIEYARNPRKNDHAVDRVAAAIKEFGFRVPIVAKSDGLLVDGHLRLKAAKKLGLKTVPVILADDLTDAQIKAFRLSVNRMAELAEWDTDLLRLELDELSELNFDLGLLGFDNLEELMAPAATEGLTDPDDVPEVPADPVTVLGDVWLLGRHRLVCGSSMGEQEVRLAVGEGLADMVFTDPPYGVSYLGSGASGSISGDISQAAIPVSFKQALDFATKKDARLYFCGGSSNVSMYYAIWDAYLRSMPSMIIWDKGGIVLRRNNYHSQYEIIFYGWKGAGGDGKLWFSGRKQDEASDIWQIKRDNGKEYLHPTQKPTALAQRAINNSCPPGGVVYEPFSGSGSTIIAAEMTGRTCHAIELAPEYVDVTVQRWQSFTGEQATLEEDGRTFADVALERTGDGARAA